VKKNLLILSKRWIGVGSSYGMSISDLLLVSSVNHCMSLWTPQAAVLLAQCLLNSALS